MQEGGMQEGDVAPHAPGIKNGYLERDGRLESRTVSKMANKSTIRGRAL
jgi:hypothetical protein